MNSKSIIRLQKRKIIEYYYKIKYKINYYFINDKIFTYKIFKHKLGRELELANPVKYNDKLQWLKLFWRDSKAHIYADKYEVRKYIKETIGDEYLNEVYGIYDDVNEIDIAKLPKSFVLKATHGSGMVILCKDKSLINWNEELTKMKKWLKDEYYIWGREWVYKGIKPRIICEKYIETDNQQELKDYRFFCFNGEPRIICVDLSITDKTKTRRNIYDLNWNFRDVQISYPNESNIIEKPNKLDEMIDLSRKLSKNFIHVRIDFYYNNDQITFGEITFFHQNGFGVFHPEEFEVEMGDYLKLPYSNK